MSEKSKPKSKRKKNDRYRTYYDSGYDQEEFQVMKRYGASDLYNEVEVVRALMFRTLGKMNQDIKKLTFQDHLSALHAFSRAAGRVAHLMEVQQKLFPPQEEFYQMVRDFNDKMADALDEDIASLERQGKEVPDWMLELQTKNFQRLFQGQI